MKRALISVTDKTGVVEFAKGLVQLGYEILSTGGTAKTLTASGLKVLEVAEASGSPEIFDGRVKTLHPKIHGGILFERDNPKHQAEAKQHGIQPIDVIAVNLYDFGGEAVSHGLKAEDAIHHIDVGGPAMLRAAAKSLVVSTPQDYKAVIAYLEKGKWEVEFRKDLAAKTFALVSRYDGMVASYLSGAVQGEPSQKLLSAQVACSKALPALQPRYGENPHQKAAFYTSSGSLPFEQIQGKELSYNNLLDVDAAWALAQECAFRLHTTAIAIVKHSSPCGVAVGAVATKRALGAVGREAKEDLHGIFERSLLCDRRSAFGGIVAVSVPLDGPTAEAMASIFLECIAAPDFSPEALHVLSAKKNVRLLRMPMSTTPNLESTESVRWNVRSCLDGYLWQSGDDAFAPPEQWKKVAGKAADAECLRDLVLAQLVAKHGKSNAVAFVKNGATVAIGCGQTSRIDAAEFALKRAETLHGSAAIQAMVMGSDAFFPFRDCVDLAARYGVRAIVEPGGSQRDGETIAAAEEHGLSLYFSGMRHFRH